MELSVDQTQMIVVSIEMERRRRGWSRTTDTQAHSVQRSVGQHSDFKENALGNTKPMETGDFVPLFVIARIMRVLYL